MSGWITEKIGSIEGAHLPLCSYVTCKRSCQGKVEALEEERWPAVAVFVERGWREKSLERGSVFRLWEGSVGFAPL